MRTLAVLSLALLFSWPMTFGQLRPTRGVYRVEVTEIPVDVMVLDPKGNPILDLKKDDFQVWEEGVLQPIVNFSIESFSENVEPDAARSSLAAVASAKPVGHRTIVVLLGNGRFEEFNTIQNIINFVGQDLKPNDLVSIMAYNRASRFTADHAENARVLERYSTESPKIRSAMWLRRQGLAAAYSKNRYATVQDQIDGIFSVPGAIAANPLPVNLTTQISGEGELQETLSLDARAEMANAHADLEAFKAAAAGRGGVSGEVGAGPQPSAFEDLEFSLKTDLPFEEYVAKRISTMEDLEHLISAIEYLRFMPGEKHVIFVNDQGLYLSRMQHEKGLASVAGDARVRIHTLQAGGMPKTRSMYDADFDGFRSVVEYGHGSARRQGQGFISNAFSLAAAAELAELTGGLSFSRSNISKALHSINTASNSLYALTYRPAAGKRDGSFRRIQVTVKRKGARVHHRRGYYAIEELQPYDRDTLMTHTRTAAALQYQDLVRGIPIACAVETARSEPGSYLASITLRLTPPPEVFRLVEDRHSGKLAVSYFLVSNEGKIIQESWDDIDLNFREASYQKTITDGFELKKEFLCRGDDRYRVKVVVYDPKNDRVTTDEKPVKRP